MKRYIVLSLLFIALIPAFLSKPSPQRPKQFSLEAISAEIPFHQEWETRALNNDEKSEVASALSQPYKYLGGGGQCFCFVSSDEKYVIKFFKQKAFAPPPWMDQFAVPFLIHWLRNKKIAKGEEKRGHVYDAFRYSFEHLAEETSLLYVHLNPSEHLQKSVAFTDVEGKTHSLNMDDLPFVVQRKGRLAADLLDEKMRNNDLAGAEQTIDELLSIQFKLYRKGFRNRDPNFRGNYGFLGTSPFVIDVGRMSPLKGEKMGRIELDRTTRKLRLHIAARHPQLLSHFDQSLKKINNEAL